MAKLKKETRDKIVVQALKEIQFDRTYKQGKVRNWQKNEDLYYSRKVQPDTSRSNVDLGQMSAFVHTLLSKIDNPLTFKYKKRKEAQLNRVKRLNAVRAMDQENDDWDIKDIAGKKQGVIYGRCINSYYADSVDGVYQAHLDNVDVYEFLIDPAGGGLDIDRAFNLGRYGVVRTRSELMQGIKSKRYLKNETQSLLDGSGNAASAQSVKEKQNQTNRTYDTNVWTSNKEVQNQDKFIFWEWYTTFYDEDTEETNRYYLLLNENGGAAIRVEKLADMFPVDKKIGDAMWPFWTWAAFIDLTEFWTPSYCDYVREIFMAEAVSVNQMLDNSEQINKPQKVINVGAIENLAELKYKRDGYIRVKAAFDVDKALQVIKVAAIDGPIKVFELLDGIQGKASGVTDGAKGVDKQDTLGVYEGNQQAAADRFGLLNKSYAFGYKRFARLHKYGVNDHLTKKMAVDMMGPDGVQIEMVSRRDIFRKDDDFGIIVEASDAETALSEAEKRNKLTFLDNQSKLAPGTSPQNHKKAYEIGASIAGFNEEDIRQLLDTSDFGDATIMSEAERDIERIMDGEIIKPNRGANTAYKQRFVDYMNKNDESITDAQFNALASYVLKLDPIIMKNMVSMANANMARMANAMPIRPGVAAPVAPGGAASGGDPSAPVLPG